MNKIQLTGLQIKKRSNVAQQSRQPTCKWNGMHPMEQPQREVNQTNYLSKQHAVSESQQWPECLNHSNGLPH